MIFVSFISGFNCRNRRHTVWQSRPFYFTFLLFLCVGITPTAKLCMHVHTKFNKACSILHYLERGRERERVYINNVMSISYNFHQPCCHSLKPVCLIVCPNTSFSICLSVNTCVMYLTSLSLLQKEIATSEFY